jgi:hypothetical protein
LASVEHPVRCALNAARFVLLTLCTAPYAQLLVYCFASGVVPPAVRPALARHQPARVMVPAAELPRGAVPASSRTPPLREQALPRTKKMLARVGLLPPVARKVAFASRGGMMIAASARTPAVNQLMRATLASSLRVAFGGPLQLAPTSNWFARARGWHRQAHRAWQPRIAWRAAPV